MYVVILLHRSRAPPTDASSRTQLAFAVLSSPVSFVSDPIGFAYACFMYSVIFSGLFVFQISKPPILVLEGAVPLPRLGLTASEHPFPSLSRSVFTIGRMLGVVALADSISWALGAEGMSFVNW